LALVNFSRNKKKRKAANDFIFWLINKENTITMFKRVGYLPVRKSAVNSLELKAFIKKNPNFEVAINELPFSRALPHHKEYFKINQTLIDMLEKILMEGADPIVELKKTEDEINRMLE
jgi:sn-glycerol 3-phosphate transport system substrate-binding protein